MGTTAGNAVRLMADAALLLLLVATLIGVYVYEQATAEPLPPGHVVAWLYEPAALSNVAGPSAAQPAPAAGSQRQALERPDAEPEEGNSEPPDGAKTIAEAEQDPATAKGTTGEVDAQLKPVRVLSGQKSETRDLPEGPPPIELTDTQADIAERLRQEQEEQARVDERRRALETERERQRQEQLAAREEAAEAIRKQAVEAEREGDLAKALQCLQTLARSYRDTAAANQTQHRIPQVSGALRERETADLMQRAIESQAAGRLAEARQSLTRVIQLDHAAPAADQARERLQDLAKLEAEQAARDAAEKLRAAVEAQEAGRLDEARTMLQDVTKQYRATLSAKEAERKLQEVQAAISEQESAKIEQESAEMLAQAKTLYEDGRQSEARQKLEVLTRVYGNTTAANQGRHALRLIVRQEEERRNEKAFAALREAVEAQQAGKLDQAQQQLRTIIKVYGDTPAAREARSLDQQVRTAVQRQQAEALLQQASDAREAGNLAQARSHLKSIISRYRTTPAAKAASRQLELLQRLETTQREGEASQALKAAVAAAEAGSPEEAAKLYRDLANRYPGTSAAGTASRRLRDAQRSMLAQQQEEARSRLAQQEEEASRALKAAVAADEAGRAEEAAKLYRDLANRYSGTSAAGTASRRLRDAQRSMLAQQQEEARSRLAQQEEEASQALEQALTAQREGRIDEASRQFNALTVRYSGTPSADKARGHLREIQTEQRSQQAADALEAATRLQQEGKVEEACSACTTIMRTYSDTPQAIQASRMVQKLMPALQAIRDKRNQERLAEREKAQQEAARRQEAMLAERQQQQEQQQQQRRAAAAARALSSAKSLSQAGQISLARAAYQAIVASYPGSPEAATAEMWLRDAAAAEKAVRHGAFVRESEKKDGPQPATTKKKPGGTRQIAPRKKKSSALAPSPDS